MKKMNKKGFTIVELVIVIAVIAILAAVMIPTFGGIIKKANKSAAEQEAKAVWKDLYGVDLADGTLDGKEGTTAIGAEYNYSATSFTYTAKGYTVSYNGTTWSTVEAAGNQG